MGFYSRYKITAIVLGGASSLIFNQLPLPAQIRPDNSLPVNSQVIRQGNTRVIEAGTSRGNNLFHSFKEFSLPLGEVARFDNAFDIKNIISRVTGKSVSNIDGLIEANGSANLLLMNPNGIIFGPNAKLDVGGSFIATTAGSLIFDDGFVFAADDRVQTSPLLTVTAPVGLAFSKNSGSIRVLGNGHALVDSFFGLMPTAVLDTNGLQVDSGKTLALIGGDVIFNGANLFAKDGRIEVGGVETGTVRLDTPDNSFGYADVDAFRDINLADQSLIDVSGASGGNVQVYGAAIDITDGSVIRNQNQGVDQSGAVKVRANERLRIDGTTPDLSVRSGIITEAVGFGQGGEINIHAPKLTVSRGGRLRVATYSPARSGDLTLSIQNMTVTDGGVVAVSSFGPGSGGNLRVNARDIRVGGLFPVEIGVLEDLDPTIVLADFASFIAVTSFASGPVGKAEIRTHSLVIEGGGGVASVARSTGKGADLDVLATGDIHIIGGSTLDPITLSTLVTATNSSGDAGDLYLSAQNLRLSSGGNIGSSVFAEGKGGNVVIDVNDAIEIAGVSPFLVPSLVNSSTAGAGDAGNINVNSRKLIQSDRADIGTASIASGDAGNLTINATEFVKLSGGSRLASFVVQDEVLGPALGLPPVPSGLSGNLSLTTPTLTITDGAQVSVGNEGTESAGRLEITAESILLDQLGQISAISASGQGGDIRLHVDDLRLTNGGSINAMANGAGDGGNIFINSKYLTVQEGSIVADANQGTGGNVGLIANNRLILDETGRITASTEGEGGGGNVDITAGDAVVFGAITANAESGPGGRIELNTQNLFLDPDATITASSGLGDEFEGTVIINTEETSPTNPLTPEIDISDATEVASLCSGGKGDSSRFVNVGRGGRQNQIEDPLVSYRGWGETVEEIQVDARIPQATALVEAQGWVQKGDEIVLVAEAPETSPESIADFIACNLTEGEGT